MGFNFDDHLTLTPMDTIFHVVNVGAWIVIAKRKTQGRNRNIQLVKLKVRREYFIAVLSFMLLISSVGA